MARGEVARMFVAIGADVREAVKAIQQVNGNLGDLRRDSKRTADAWSGAMGTLARTGLAIQGVRDLYRGVKDLAGGVFSLSLGADQDAVSMNQLLGSVRNTGRAIDMDLRRKLDDALQSMEDTTLFSDNELREALQTLVIGTGDVDEGLRRLPIAADLAAREQLGLSQSSRLFARITDDSLTELNKYGIGLDQTSQKSGELAAAQMLAARAHITVDGALKAVGNESIRKRWGIPDPKDIRGAVNEAALLAEAKKSVQGGAVEAAAGLEGDADQVRKGLKNIRNELGGLLMPVAKGAVRFLSDSLKGVRRLIMLFSTDISGPRIGGVRKLWKQIFGTELPGALGAVVDGFNKIKDRITQFVKDLNSTDENTVRGAVKTLFDGLRTDIPKALGELGTELDKMGPVGFGLKLLATSIAIEKATGGAVSPTDVLGVIRDAMQISWLSVGLFGKGPTITAAAGIVLAIGVMDLANQIEQAKSISDWSNLFGSIVAAAGLTLLGISLGLSLGPALLIGVSAALIIQILGVKFDDLSGKNINDEIAKEYGGGAAKVKVDASGLRTARDEITQSSPPATLNDIYAAYERVTGNQIGIDYARQIAAQGFSYSQVASENVFSGTVSPAYMPKPSDIREFAMGGSGVVTEPTLFRAGERGAEKYAFEPVGRSGGGSGGGVSIGSIVVRGNVDSRERVEEIGTELYRRARLAGLAV